MSQELLFQVLSGVLILYTFGKDLLYMREIKAFREWHMRRTLEWEAERQRILDKAFALSEKEKLAIIDLERRQMDIREAGMQHQTKTLQYLNSGNGDDPILLQRVKDARDKARKKALDQKEKDSKILESM